MAQTLASPHRIKRNHRRRRRAASGRTVYAYVGGNPLSYIDPWGLTQCDIDFARDFVQEHNPGAELPETIGTMETSPGHLGRTFHPKSPGNPNPGQFSVSVNSGFLNTLDRAGFDDLLETMIHEQGHVGQPDSAWTETDSAARGAFHGQLTTDAGNRAIELRDQYKQERENCGCK